MRPQSRYTAAKPKTWERQLKDLKVKFVIVKTLLSNYNYSDAAVTILKYDFEALDAVSAEIIVKAGITIEKIGQEKVTVISTLAGKYDWKYIFHIILPEKPEMSISFPEYIQIYITECLKQADEKQLNSISFPLLDFKELFNIEEYDESSQIDDKSIIKIMMESIINAFKNQQILLINF
jgi:hypothetical protein